MIRTDLYLWKLTYTVHTIVEPPPDTDERNNYDRRWHHDSDHTIVGPEDALAVAERFCELELARRWEDDDTGYPARVEKVVVRAIKQVGVVNVVDLQLMRSCD